MTKKAIVLLSGGLDSTTALALAINQGMTVEALTVDYGQRHHREIQAAREIAKHYDTHHVVVSVDSRLFGGSALTGDAEVPPTAAKTPDATYVPARNTVLLALGAARAETIGAHLLIIGANADDAAAYPDCRSQYIEAFRDVLVRGTIGNIWISAPFLHLPKSGVKAYARELDVPFDLTWSCYRGGDEPCGQCGACHTNGYIVSTRAGEVTMATDADEAALIKAYGKTSEELAEEAERGYPVGRLQQRTKP